MTDPRATRFDALLPPGVRCAEWLAGEPPGVLLPAEAALGEGAAAPRLAELAAGRQCARQALFLAGLPAGPVLRGPRREPLFPAGAIGSITHTTGYCAAVAAPRGAVAALGIDAEANEPMPQRMLERIASEAECRMAGELEAALPGLHAGRLLFSLKEAVYKAWYPLAREPLGFREAELRIDARSGRCDVRLLREAVPAAWRGLDCRWSWDARRVYALVACIDDNH